MPEFLEGLILQKGLTVDNISVFIQKTLSINLWLLLLPFVISDLRDFVINDLAFFLHKKLQMFLNLLHLTYKLLRISILIKHA